MSKDTGGSAYPYEYTYHGVYGDSREHVEGMTLRDHFAGIALSTMETKDKTASLLAERAYFIADAMIKERNR